MALLIVGIQAVDTYRYLDINTRKMDKSSAKHYGYDKKVYLDFLYTVKHPSQDGPRRYLYYALKSYNALHSNITPNVLNKYQRFKFIAYDQVQLISVQNPDYRRVENILGKNLNIGLISSDDRRHLRQNQGNIPLHAQPITKKSDQFEVLDYSVNHVVFKTHFKVPKFLVYNDSYHENWQVDINGDNKETLRANVAFKGLWIPKGENIVTYRFGTINGRLINILLFILFYSMLTLLIVQAIKDKKHNPYENYLPLLNIVHF